MQIRLNRVWLLGALLLSSQSFAATVYMQMSGVTTTTNASIPSLATGTAFTITYSFDSNAVDSNPSGSTGVYALLGMEITIGSNDYLADPIGTASVTVANNIGGSYDDFYEISSGTATLTGPLINGASLKAVSISLRDDQAGQFISDALLLNPDPLSQFEGKQFFLTFDLNPGSASIKGNITDWTVVQAAVPVPAAIWLMGSAVGLLGWVRRRQARP